MGDLTRPNIHRADPEQISRQIAERRGDKYARKSGRTRWDWPDYPARKPHKYGPQPYATEWWAAGPLLEELQGHRPSKCFRITKYTDSPRHWPAECRDEWGSVRLAEEWRCGPLHKRSRKVLRFAHGDAGPLAIAKAWLLAYERGLLEANNE